MARNYVSPGATMSYAHTAAVTSGEPIRIGRLIGVALGAYDADAVGEYAIEGVYDLPFVTGAAIAAGNQVIWDESADLFDDHSATPATGDVSVCCISMSTVASTAAGASYPVKINVGIGTVA